MNFLEKLDAVLFAVYEKYIYKYKFLPMLDVVAKKYFGSQIADLSDIEKNISMLFLNTNPIIHGVRPYGPNVIEFGGGIHLKPLKPLPLVRILRIFYSR